MGMINEICTFAPKSKIKAGEATKDGQYIFFTSSEDESKKYNEYIYDGEGIIMGTGGNATLHYYNGKYATSTDCLVLLPDKEIIDCKYLYYFLLSNMSLLEAGFKGAGLKHTNKKYIGNIEINQIPTKDQQLHVVSILDTVTSLIVQQQKEINLLDELIKSRFVEMFGDTFTNKHGYPILPLSDSILFMTSGSRGWAKYCVDNGLEWFITIKNVKDCKVTTDNIQSINAPNNAEAKRTKVVEGDLLVSITADLGRTGVVTKEIANHGAYINQHLSCIRLDKTKFNPLYVAYFMESESGKPQFEEKNQNGVKAGLNFDSIKSLKVLIPPIRLQNQFADFVAKVEQQKATVQKSIEKLETLKKSLMQEYFG